MKSEKGFSLVEVLIAIAISGVAVLAAYTFGIRMMILNSNLQGKILEQVDNTIFLKEIVEGMSHSHVMRLGVFKCEDNHEVSTTNKSQNYLLKEGEGRFTFAYSSTFSVAGRDLNAEGNLIFSSLRSFYENDIVLLVSSADSNLAGLAQIKSIDRLKNQVQVTDVSIKNSGCVEESAKNIKMIDLLKVKTTFLVYKINIMSFFIEKSYLKAQKYFAAESKMIDFQKTDRVEEVYLDSTWATYRAQGSPEKVVDKSGRYNVKIEFKVKDLSTKKLNSFSASAGYDLSSARKPNLMVTTTSEVIESTYPTCSVVVSSAPNLVIVPACGGIFNGSQIYKVDGFMSGLDNPVPIDVSLVKSSLVAGTDIRCWPLKNNPNIVSGKIKEGDCGVADYFSLSPDVSGIYSNYVCAVKGEVSLQGGINYYDTVAGRPLSMPCSSSNIRVPSAFKYDSNGPTKCYKEDRFIDIGTLIEDGGGSNLLGPTLYVDETSCVWKRADGSITPQTGCFGYDPTYQLEKVFLRPLGVKINGAGATPLEVICE